jgi:hypothetical protein
MLQASSSVVTGLRPVMFHGAGVFRYGWGKTWFTSGVILTDVPSRTAFAATSNTDDRSIISDRGHGKPEN